MAFVRNPHGVIGEVADSDLARAVKEFGYTPVTQAEVAADDAAKAREKEAGEHPIQAAGEGLVKGAVDMFGAPARAAGGLLETGIGPNVVSDTLGGITGDNALAAVKSVSQGFGPSQEQNDASTAQYLQGVGEREKANPLSSGAGYLGGGALGMGPAMALASPVGAAVEKGLGGIAQGAAGPAGAFAEGAVVGGIQGVATATDEAHMQGSYLRGEQALAAGGLGALLGGSLNLAGRAMGELYGMRKAAKGGPNIPDLEVPPEETAFPRTGGGSKEPSIPNLEVNAGKDVKDWIDSGPGFEKTEFAAGREDVTSRGGIPAAAREEATVRPGKTPALEKPSTEPDLSLGGLAEDAPAPPDLEPIASRAVGEAFPRGTRYMSSPENAEGDLPLGGMPGKDINPEELRKVSAAEDYNSRARAAKVDKLLEHLPPLTTSKDVLAMDAQELLALAKKADVPKISQNTLEALADAVKEQHAEAHMATVNRLLDIVPEGATPDYILDMTKKQRMALADFVGVEYRGDATWRALADAVGEREDIPVGKPTAHLPPAAEVVPEMGASVAAPVAPIAQQPKFPTPGDFRPGAGAGVPEAPQAGAVMGSGAPYKAPAGGGGSDAAIGVPAPSTGPVGPPAGTDKKGWSKWVDNIGKGSAKWAARKAVGGVLGGAFGPAGYAAGYVAGAAYDGLGALVKTGAKLSAKAVGGALELGTQAPKELKLAAEADIVRKVFHKNQDSPEAAFQARMKEMRAFKASPDLLTQAVAKAFGPLAIHEKGAVLASVQASQRGIDYLLEIAPHGKPDVNSLTPMSSATVPNRSDLAEFARVYTAVMAPKSVLANIEDGTVTTSQIKAIKNVYPQWYQENIVTPFGDKLRARDAAGETILPIERKVVDVSLDIHSGVEGNDFVDKYGQKFTQALAAQQPPQPKQGGGGKGRKLTHASSLTSRMQTQTDSILGPIQ